MKRSPMKPSTTAIKRTTALPKTKAMPVRRSKPRSAARPKMTPARRNAKDQPCTLRFPGCTHDRETTVLCHLTEFGGGGMGMKPHDSEAVFGCHHCHGVLDGRITLIPELRHEVNYHNILWALIRTLRSQREAGVLIYKGES